MASEKPCRRRGRMPKAECMLRAAYGVKSTIGKNLPNPCRGCDIGLGLMGYSTPSHGCRAAAPTRAARSGKGDDMPRSSSMAGPGRSAPPRKAGKRRPRQRTYAGQTFEAVLSHVLRRCMSRAQQLKGIAGMHYLTEQYNAHAPKALRLTKPLYLENIARRLGLTVDGPPRYAITMLVLDDTAKRFAQKFKEAA